MKKRKSRLLKRQAYMGYVYIMPFLIGFAVLFVRPLISSFRFSVSRISLTPTGIVTEYVGLQNYSDILRVDPVFNQNFVQTMQELLWIVPAVIIYSIFIANLLNRKFTGRTVARAIFFLPVLATMVFYTPVEQIAMGDPNAVINQLATNISLTRYLNSLNLSAQMVTSITTIADNIYAVISITGIQIFLFLAALQAIPGHLYEASSIEGASAWDNLWKITVPMISPYIIICVIYTIIDSYYREGNLIAQFIRNITRQRADYALGAAAAWIYMGAVLVFLFIIGWFLKKVTIRFE
jgi:ABC-type sugar transport system permease subunit